MRYRQRILIRVDNKRGWGQRPHHDARWMTRPLSNTFLLVGTIEQHATTSSSSAGSSYIRILFTLSFFPRSMPCFACSAIAPHSLSLLLLCWDSRPNRLVPICPRCVNRLGVSEASVLRAHLRRPHEVHVVVDYWLPDEDRGIR